MPQISVIIPVFNCEKYIIRAISSVLSQTLSDCEIIVINDGSTDNTCEIVRKYISDNSALPIKLISTTNQGVSAARNLGLDAADGDYVVFLDADDWLEQNAFEEWLKLKNNNPNALVTTSKKYISESEEGILNREFTDVDCKKVFTKNYYAVAMADERYNLQNASSKLFNRNIIEKNGIRFDEDIAFGEDGLFVFRYALCVDKIVFEPQLLLNAMVRMDSATHNASFNARWFEGIVSVQRMKKLCSENSVLTKSLEQWEISKVYSLARRYFAYSKSREYYNEIKSYLKEYYSLALASNLTFKSKILWSVMLIFPLSFMSHVSRIMNV